MDGRLCLRLVATGVLLALALAVALLRLQRLDALPPGIVGDENRNGVLALRVLQGEHAIFFSNVDQGREPSVIYALALTTLLFGRTLFAMHLPTALGSAGMVFAAFWMGRLLFGRDEEGEQATSWRGLFIGGVGAGLMVVSVGQTILGRTGYSRTTHMPLLLTLCLGLLWWGWKERSWRRVALAGACAGLMPYTYIVARFVPFLFIFFCLSFLLPLRADSWEKVRRELRWAAVFAGVAGLVAAPLLVHFALNPEHLFLRSKHLWILDPARSQGDLLGNFLINVWDHLSLLGLRGDLNWRNNYAGQLMLNPAEALFFWFGVGVAVWRWRWPAYRLLLIWLATMMFPAFLAKDFLAPSSMRILGASPAIYLLVGVGVWEAFRFLRERFFRENATRAAIAAGSVISVAILVQGIVTYRTYFHKWAFAPEALAEFFVPWPDVIQTLNAQSSGADVLYLLPHYRDYGYEYLYQGAAQVHLINPNANAPDLAQMVESALAAMEGAYIVRVVDWKMRGTSTERDVGRFSPSLNKHGHYLNSDEYPDFRIHNYAAISLDRPWALNEQQESKTIDYDGGITLRRVVLGQGLEQLPIQQLLDLEWDRPLWMVLQWQTNSDLDAVYSISLRLYNVEDEIVYQEDDVLWNPAHWPTSYWTADAPVNTLAWLDFPADLPASNYELRLVVYDAETLVPTVEIGVWEAETTVARLRLAED